MTNIKKPKINTSGKKPEVKLKKDGTSKKSGGKRTGSGQPKKEPTALMNFRILVVQKTDLRKKYGKKINQMFKEWVDNLL